MNKFYIIIIIIIIGITFGWFYYNKSTVIEEGANDKIRTLVTNAYKTHLSRYPESTGISTAGIDVWLKTAKNIYDQCIPNNNEQTCLDKVSSVFKNAEEAARKHSEYVGIPIETYSSL